MGGYNPTRHRITSIKILNVRSELQFFESLVNVSGYCGGLNKYDPL